TTVAISVAGAVDVHAINTRAHIDSGANINLDNTGAGSEQSVFVVAGRSYEVLSVGLGGALSGVVAAVPVASVPVVLGGTEAYIGRNSNTAADSHTGAAFDTTVNASGDVQVAARANESIITLGAGLAGGLIVGVAGSVSVLVLDVHTLAAIAGNVKVSAG